MCKAEEVDFTSLPYIVAVDFDGTLFEDKFPEIGEPNIDLINKLIQKRREGQKVILWTCRTGKLLLNAVHYCLKYGLTFDAVNENIPEVKKLTGDDTRKVYANLYLDDKARVPKFKKRAY
jgi:hypothetical protein